MKFLKVKIIKNIRKRLFKIKNEIFGKKKIVFTSLMYMPLLFNMYHFLKLKRKIKSMYFPYAT